MLTRREGALAVNLYAVPTALLVELGYQPATNVVGLVRCLPASILLAEYAPFVHLLQDLG